MFIKRKKFFLVIFLLFFVFGQKTTILVEARDYPISPAGLNRAVKDNENRIFLEKVPGMEDLSVDIGSDTDPTKMIITYLN